MTFKAFHSLTCIDCKQNLCTFISLSIEIPYFMMRLKLKSWFWVECVHFCLKCIKQLFPLKSVSIFGIGWLKEDLWNACFSSDRKTLIRSGNSQVFILLSIISVRKQGVEFCMCSRSGHTSFLVELVPYYSNSNSKNSSKYKFR